MKKKLIAVLLLILSTNTTIFASTNGYGTGVGRTNSLNVNDYVTTGTERFTFNYNITSGVNNKDKLGIPTQTDIVPRNKEDENIRRNKDVSFVPPQYGLFSGEFDRERSNPYITIQPDNYARNTTNTSLTSKSYDTLSFGVNGKNASDTGVLMPTSINSGQLPETSNIVKSNNVTIQEVNGNKDEIINTVTPYSDGSIGSISIESLRNLNVKVYAGESLDNMKIGVGQFAFTSQWDGNIGVAGHNSGSAGYFKDIWNLREGSILKYTTKIGTREYKLTLKEKINVNNFETLGFTNDNRITIITCVKDSPNERWSIVFEVVK